MRDYIGAYLPQHRKAPTQTLLSLYGYNDGLKAFRTWDASGAFVFERCEGVLQGRPVAIALDIDQREALERRPDAVLKGPAYAACFRDVPQRPGQYLTPQ